MLSPLGTNNKNKEGAGYGGSETERSTVAPFLFDRAGFLQLESHLHAKNREHPAKCETRPAKRAWVFKFKWSWCELQSCYSAPSLRRSTSAQTKSPQQLRGTVLHLIKLADVPAGADTEQVREQLLLSKAAQLLGLQRVRHLPSALSLAQSCLCSLLPSRLATKHRERPFLWWCFAIQESGNHFRSTQGCKGRSTQQCHLPRLHRASCRKGKSGFSVGTARAKWLTKNCSFTLVWLAVFKALCSTEILKNTTQQGSKKQLECKQNHPATFHHKSCNITLKGLTIRLQDFSETLRENN